MRADFHPCGALVHHLRRDSAAGGRRHVIGPEYPRLLLLFRTAVVLYVVMPALYAGGVAHYEGSCLPEGFYRR